MGDATHFQWVQARTDREELLITESYLASVPILLAGNVFWEVSQAFSKTYVCSHNDKNRIGMQNKKQNLRNYFQKSYFVLNCNQPTIPGF